jgi:diguanylate cyclase (GGDEF)-like protein
MEETSMRRKPDSGADVAGNGIQQEELRGISRTVAEIHWLLMILVLLYMIFSGDSDDTDMRTAITAGLFFYAAMVMSFRYANFYRRETRLKIAIETFCMIAMITWSLWYTGKTHSPLINLFLLPVITSSLALSKVSTLLLVGVIAACFVALESGDGRLYSLVDAGGTVAQLAPVLLVAYITTMFSADIRYGIGKAKLLSETDELTGLFNLRGFAIATSGVFGQALRYERPACVLMVDSDDLKPINDKYGHQAGNQLLLKVARCISNELRHTDIAARYGGDEFVVLLPETPMKGAVDVAERIRIAVSDSVFEVGPARVKNTVSIGIASYPEHGRTLDAITARADQAMYEAKKRGRNRVECYNPTVMDTASS